MPLLVVSQALPVFALAPLLVLWLGYGMASKVAMAVLIIFFPVTAAFLDGLRRTEPGWLELARTMDARPLAILAQIRVPAALPALASGLRVAAAVAPIGAVIGEWVGSSAGLGYLMLHANARMQVDLMFAAAPGAGRHGAGPVPAVDRGARRARPLAARDAGPRLKETTDAPRPAPAAWPSPCCLAEPAGAGRRPAHRRARLVREPGPRAADRRPRAGLLRRGRASRSS